MAAPLEDAGIPSEGLKMSIDMNKKISFFKIAESVVVQSRKSAALFKARRHSACTHALWPLAACRQGDLRRQVWLKFDAGGMLTCRLMRHYFIV
ncbi:MAG: hypothetical protein LBV27_10480 [Oscillospiraceae bacterium]|nr:hypothetical protein [Oscillospiraceae bacterium]